MIVPILRFGKGGILIEKILTALRTQGPIEPIRDTNEINRSYRYWQIRIMYSMMITYATFYFVRKNFSMANNAIAKEFGFSNTEMGIILSVATIVYAGSKFLSGILADHANPRYFMAIGLVLSAIMNIFFGLSSALPLFILFWALNNLFQGMGMPPCSRLLTIWFPPNTRGRAWGVWNASHQIGGGIIVILAGFLVSTYGWRAAFYVPAIIAIAVAIFTISRLRDTPESIGLPSVEKFHENGTLGTAGTGGKEETSREIFVKYVLKNKIVWIVSIANFFVYIVRIGILDWAPKFLENARGFTTEQAGLAVSGFEFVGIAGAFASGWISDKVFKGRRGPVSVFFMLWLTLSVVAIFFVPSGNFWLMLTALLGVGFFVYGPQMMVAVAATDFATSKAAAAAVGLTGLFGYIGATVCGVGTGMIVDRWGWNGGIIFYITSAVIGMLLFLLIWGAKLPESKSSSVG